MTGLLGKYSAEARSSMMQIAVNAAGQNHDLSGFEPVQDADGNDNGYQAICRLCGGSAFVADSGLHYSLLADHCPGQGSN